MTQDDPKRRAKLALGTESDGTETAPRPTVWRSLLYDTRLRSARTQTRPHLRRCATRAWRKRHRKTIAARERLRTFTAEQQAARKASAIFFTHLRRTKLAC